MRLGSTRLLAIAVLALGLVGSASGADATQATVSDYTPSGGPSLNLIGTNVAVWFEGGQAINCADFDPSGTLTNPGAARPVGAPAGSIVSLASACTTDTGASLTFISGTWSFEVTGLATGTAWPARFTGVEPGLERWRLPGGHGGRPGRRVRHRDPALHADELDDHSDLRGRCRLRQPRHLTGRHHRVRWLPHQHPVRRQHCAVALLRR
ncbi:hypothetical protein G5V59_11925 [Nocardioides sp. W3-2-3]|uniref:hypothetical protein n=1 Tax=Nocardioides convexus TaxID=2712224 RepID=UPI0024185CC1|nr:hypothetical protein [Nocardioides convexus]NHA00498.1 hypothetical protein [Nocardioides convexus]